MIDTQGYVRGLEARLRARGFSPIGTGSEPLALARFHRRAFSLTKFGFLDTLCSVVLVQESASTDSLMKFSRDAFAAALKAKIWLPRGLGGTALSYAAIVMDHASPDAQHFVNTYQPKHWASFEFPVLVDLSANRVLLYEKTPVFGSAYYAGFRREAAELFAPDR
jgi:hypothetical protein